MKKSLSIALLAVLTTGAVVSQTTDSILYKQVDSTSLYLYIDYPPGKDDSLNYPAMVFFFGGGWVGGTPAQFAPQAGYFAQRGMVCFRADYRVESRHGTSPFESLKDAKSAMRFVRAHADEFAIDPERIVASGGSAGGHLAAATAVIEGFNEEGEDLSISCVPNALVLFNPVIDNGPGGYGYERVGETYRSFSPLHNLHKDAPPTVIFLGTEDQLIPVETVNYYKTVMEKVGSRCELFLYDGKGHGFFNYNQFENYRLTLLEANRFLISLDYLLSTPEIEIK
jgi:acetyl esterase/lipase